MYMKEVPELGGEKWANLDEISFKYKYNPETDIFIGRNPFNFDDAIGYRDDRHVFLCAGTRAGKGRSIIINNLLNWRGSVVAPDPKGENASICAERRANGDGEHCVGLGQKTYVLDPYGMAQVPDELRASCNLMDMLIDEETMWTQSIRLAEALRLAKEGGESESWSKEACAIVGAVIAHVKTSPMYDEDQKNLVTVRNLVQQGNYDYIKLLEDRNMAELELAKEEGREPDIRPVPSAYAALFAEMEINEALNGAIAREGRKLLELHEKGERHWQSLIHNAQSEVSFINDFQMEKQLTNTEHSGRSFDIRDLHQDEKGVSVFLCLPDDPDHPAVRWQKALIWLILNDAKKDQHKPKCGQQTLMMLDEFASMGKADEILRGMNSVAGAGIKLFIAVTDLGQQKQTYKDAWTALLSQCGVHIFFHINDHFTGKAIEENIGETQIILHQRNISIAEQEGEGTSETYTEMEGWSETDSEGLSEGESHSRAKGHTKTHNLGISVSDAETWQHSEGTNESETKGSNTGWAINNSHSRGGNRNYNQGRGYNHQYNGLFGAPVRSTNGNRGSSYGDNWNQTHGRTESGGVNQSNTIGHNVNDSVGGSKTFTENESRGTSDSETMTHGITRTLSKTLARGVSGSFSRAKGTSTNQSVTLTRGVSEVIHKRPLITTAEQKRWLWSEDDREHPNYPGFALIKFGGEDAFLARRCNYDQDPLFEGLFKPHYGHKYIPFSKQRLVGGQYTDDHYVPIRLPEIVKKTAARIDIDLKALTDEWVDEGDPIFEWTGAQFEENREKLNQAKQPILLEEQDLNSEKPKILQPLTVEDRAGMPVMSKMNVPSPADGKVIDFALRPAFIEDGDVMLMRFEKPFYNTDREALEESMFYQIIEYLRVQGATQAEIDAMIKAGNDMYRNEWQSYQDKLAADAAAAAEAERLRLEEEAERIRLAKKREEEKAAAEAQRKEDDRISALKREQDNFKIKYQVPIFILCVIIPLVTIAQHVGEAKFAPNKLKYSSQTKKINSWVFKWNKPPGKTCNYNNTYSVTKQYALSYGYTCIKRIGSKTSHYRNGIRLFFGAFFFPFLFLIPILIFFMFYNKNSAELEPEWNDSMPEHKTFSGQYEIFQLTTKEIWSELGGWGGFIFWGLVLIAVCFYYDTLAAKIYSSIR